MNRIYFKVSQYENDIFLGSYLEPYSQSMDSVVSEVVTLFENEEINSGREIRVQLVYMNEEDYNNLKEFEGY